MNTHYAAVTGDLAEFLLARIAEAEAAARECAKVYPSPWDVYDRGHSATVKADAPHFHAVTSLDQKQVEVGTVDWLGDALEHIAGHDPARVLAECDAKRRIIELHHTIEVYDWNPQGHCAECSDSGWDAAVDGAQPVDAPCPTLRLLALPYADRPGFREEWRPDTP